MILMKFSQMLHAKKSAKKKKISWWCYQIFAFSGGSKYHTILGGLFHLEFEYCFTESFDLVYSEASKWFFKDLSPCISFSCNNSFSNFPFEKYNIIYILSIYGFYIYHIDIQILLKGKIIINYI